MEPLPDDVTYATLAMRWKDVDGTLPENLQVRIYRSLSWIKRAEGVAPDDDTAFILYWIAFNAAYAEGKPSRAVREDEKKRFRWYFSRIMPLDVDRVVSTTMRKPEFRSRIDGFLQNEWVFQPFWDYAFYGVKTYQDSQRKFNKDAKNAKEKLDGSTSRRKRGGKKSPENDIVEVLCILFDRLYVLRNQLMHGGATWSSSKNRDQVRDGRELMAFLVPRFAYLMMNNPDPSDCWGSPPYPPSDPVHPLT